MLGSTAAGWLARKSEDNLILLAAVVELGFLNFFSLFFVDFSSPAWAVIADACFLDCLYLAKSFLAFCTMEFWRWGKLMVQYCCIGIRPLPLSGCLYNLCPFKVVDFLATCGFFLFRFTKDCVKSCTRESEGDLQV